MRVTNSMFSGSVMGNLAATMDRIYALQAQATSGKRITKASDDPRGTSTSLGLRSSLASVAQYSKNVAQGKGQLAAVDNALDSISQTLRNAKTYALSGANGALDPKTREALAPMIQQQIDSIVAQMNSTYGEKHIFGGNMTQGSPVVVDSVGPAPYKYVGDQGVASIQVNDATDVQISITASKILNIGGAADPSAPDALAVLDSIKKSLISGDTLKLQADMAKLETVMQNVVAVRAQMGVLSSQVDIHASRLTATSTDLTLQLSDVEDVDFTQVVTQLQTEQNVYQASLLVAARMSQQNLGDYLK